MMKETFPMKTNGAENKAEDVSSTKNNGSFTPLALEKVQANFPVFMKLLVALLVFAFFPFLTLNLLISWGYDSSFGTLIEQASLLPQEKAALISQLEELEHELRIRLGFGFLAFSIFMVLGVWFGTRFLVHPLTKFVDAMRQLERGNFGAKVSIHTSDEFAILGYYFNKMSRQIEEALTREQEVSRMKSEFLSIAAHQLRTPLSALKWVLYLVIEGDVGELKKSQRELLQKGYQANERMITLVNDLLDAVRIEEGRFDYRFTMGQLLNLLEEIFKETRVLAEKKQVTFQFQKPRYPIAEIAFDAVKLRLALVNVISNAIQYTPPKGRVDLKVTQEKDQLIVSVRDTGIGVPKHQLGRIFTKFFRADNAVKMQTNGSGLGLFIAKNIIQSHGGTITFTSKEGKGSVFEITFSIGGARRIIEGASRQFIVG